MTHPLKGAERIKRYSRKMIFQFTTCFQSIKTIKNFQVKNDTRKNIKLQSISEKHNFINMILILKQQIHI